MRKEKEEALKLRMLECGVHEEDLTEKFVLGSGSGGQKVNKTASCVYLKHGPTGFEVKCQRTRSRALNRYYARHELCDRIEEERRGKESKRKQEIAKIRKQKKRRSRKLQQKLVEDKRHHGKKKALRKKPDIEE